MVEREALKNANIDNVGVIPPQIWYDQLRESDDGRFMHQNGEYQRKRIRNTNSQNKIDLINLVNNV
jgi:hypothetical protein